MSAFLAAADSLLSAEEAGPDAEWGLSERTAGQLQTLNALFDTAEQTAMLEAIEAAQDAWKAAQDAAQGAAGNAADPSEAEAGASA